MILINDIADLIEGLADSEIETGCPIRDIYAVLMLVNVEVGKRMKNKVLQERESEI